MYTIPSLSDFQSSAGDSQSQGSSFADLVQKRISDLDEEKKKQDAKKNSFLPMIGKLLAAATPVAIGAALGGGQGAAIGAGSASQLLTKEGDEEKTKDLMNEKYFRSRNDALSNLLLQAGMQKDILGIKSQSALQRLQAKLNYEDQKTKQAQDFTSSENELNRQAAMDRANVYASAKRGSPEEKEKVTAQKRMDKIKSDFLNGPRGRVMTVQSMLIKQIDRDAALADMIGAPDNQSTTWKPPANESDEQLAARLNKATPQQMNMLINGLANIVGTGTSATANTDFKFREFSPESIQKSFAEFKQKYGNNPSPANAGKFLAPIINTLKREKLTMEKDRNDAANIFLNDPMLKKHHPDDIRMMMDYFGMNKNNKGNIHDMSDDEVDAELKSLLGD